MIITIIVLIILAGITISIALGENGIFKKSQKAVDEYQKQAQAEAEVLDFALDEMEGRINARTVADNPMEFYGKTLKGYTCKTVNGEDFNKNGQAVKNWKIFYSDGTNIYLIADDYISFDYAPKSANNELYINNDNAEYILSFDYVINDYTNATDITDTRVRKWLSFLNEYGTSENENIRAVAFMLDTNVWTNYAGEKAEYAIGGPTLDMFVASYNQTHKNENKTIDYKIGNENGYSVKWKDNTEEEYNYNIEGLTNPEGMDKLYVNNTTDKAYAIWLASPSCNDFECMFYVTYDGSLYGNYSYGASDPGLRPIVCLKSSVKLEKSGTDNNTYKIIEEEN